MCSVNCAVPQVSSSQNEQLVGSKEMFVNVYFFHAPWTQFYDTDTEAREVDGIWWWHKFASPSKNSDCDANAMREIRQPQKEFSFGNDELHRDTLCPIPFWWDFFVRFTNFFVLLVLTIYQQFLCTKWKCEKENSQGNRHLPFISFEVMKKFSGLKSSGCFFALGLEFRSDVPSSLPKESSSK